PETLRTLVDQARTARQDADAAAAALQPQVDQLNEQLAQLGEVAEGTTEGTAVAAQRRALTRQRDEIDGTIKRAGVLAVQATQLADDVEKQRTSQFNEDLARKVGSPLSPALWRQVAEVAPDDTVRVVALYHQGERALREAVKREGWTTPLLGLGLALLVFF
ncbi:DUF3772 domain-containing protein, partial [Xanthomonas citri pv. citri]